MYVNCHGVVRGQSPGVGPSILTWLPRVVLRPPPCWRSLYPLSYLTAPLPLLSFELLVEMEAAVSCSLNTHALRCHFPQGRCRARLALSPWVLPTSNATHVARNPILHLCYSLQRSGGYFPKTLGFGALSQLEAPRTPHTCLSLALSVYFINIIIICTCGVCACLCVHLCVCALTGSWVEAGDQHQVSEEADLRLIFLRQGLSLAWMSSEPWDLCLVPF
jgi:hypothetical protein